MKSFILSTCFFFVSITLFAQTVADSSTTLQAKPVVAATVNITAAKVAAHNKIDTILKVSFRYIFANADTCLFLAEHALALSERLYPGEVIHAESFYALGDAHRSRSEWAESEAAFLAGHNLS